MLLQKKIIIIIVIIKNNVSSSSFDVIGTLTNSGKNIQYIEQDMGEYVTLVMMTMVALL